MSLKVVETFPVNRLVNSQGVMGFRKKGFPLGGPIDPQLARVAIELTQGSMETAVFEVTARMVFEAGHDLVLGVASYDGCSRVALKEGKIYTVDAPQIGVRSYVAAGLRSGVNVERWVEIGEKFECKVDESGISFRLAELISPDLTTLRWIPLGDEFGETLRANVLPAGSRVGVRLDAGLSGRPALDLSEPSMTGVVQITPDGTMLIHGVDGPTIGGYPKVGAVVQADWGKIGQLRGGSQVDLMPVSLREALEIKAVEDSAWEGVYRTIKTALWSKGITDSDKESQYK